MTTKMTRKELVTFIRTFFNEYGVSFHQMYCDVRTSQHRSAIEGNQLKYYGLYSTGKTLLGVLSKPSAAKLAKQLCGVLRETPGAECYTAVFMPARDGALSAIKILCTQPGTDSAA